MKIRYIILIVFLFPLSYVQSGASTDDEVRKLIIAQSIAAYSGNCPCPYSQARNGSRCGGRSAWSKSKFVICYENEITQVMIQSWRKKNNLSASRN